MIFNFIPHASTYYGRPEPQQQWYCCFLAANHGSSACRLSLKNTWTVPLYWCKNYHYPLHSLFVPNSLNNSTMSHTHKHSTAFYDTPTLGDSSYSSPTSAFTFSRIPICFRTIICWCLTITSIQEAVRGYIWNLLWLYVCYCYQWVLFTIIRNLSFLCFWLSLSYPVGTTADALLAANKVWQPLR
jgi:hypothetical protein